MAIVYYCCCDKFSYFQSSESIIIERFILINLNKFGNKLRIFYYLIQLALLDNAFKLQI